MISSDATSPGPVRISIVSMFTLDAPCQTIDGVTSSQMSTSVTQRARSTSASSVPSKTRRYTEQWRTSTSTRGSTMHQCTHCTHKHATCFTLMAEHLWLISLKGLSHDNKQHAFNSTFFLSDVLLSWLPIHGLFCVSCLPLLPWPLLLSLRVWLPWIV